MGMGNSLYRVTPSAVLLQEKSAAAPEQVQLLRAGTFSHPEYGTFEITNETLAALKANFDARVRGVDLAIDYSHEAEKEAAGWITGLVLDNTGEELWATVDWTRSGKEVVEGKEYRYLSADFAFDYEDNETKEKFGPTLFGAALTNRPCIKNMAPTIELTEIQGDEMNEEVKKLKAQVEELSTKLAEAEKKCEEVKAECDKKLFDVQTNTAGLPKEELVKIVTKLMNLPGPTDEINAMGEEELRKKIDELMGKITEEQAGVEAMKKENESLKAENAKLSEERAASEKEKEFNVLLSEGKAVPAQKEAFLKGDFQGFVKLQGKLNLSEKGSGFVPGDDENNKDAQEEVLRLSKEKVKSGAAKDVAHAISLVLSENPKLHEQYRKG